MEDNVCALEGSTMSEVLAKHLNVFYTARREFIKSESDERIRRALRSKIRASEQKFVVGDKVFYKRDGIQKWLGPGSVLGQDGKIVFIRHGGFVIRASVNRVLSANNVNFQASGGDSLVEPCVGGDEGFFEIEKKFYGEKPNGLEVPNFPVQTVQ